MPLRDFVVQLDDVVSGDAVIGTLNWSRCGIVDDDIYPIKVDRDHKHPALPQELAVPSCNNSDQFLTPFEFEDVHLIWGFIKERFVTLWPSSFYGMFWCVFRGFYHVSMSLVLVLMIDNVWKTSEEVENTVEVPPGEGGDAFSQVRGLQTFRV